MNEQARARQDDSMEHRRATLEQMRLDLKRMLAGVEDQLARLETDAAEGVEQEPPPSKLATGRTHRELVLDALQDLGWPAYSRQIALYCKAMFGREIPATRFGSLG